jgi:acetyl-CoA C-acetyltransferase
LAKKVGIVAGSISRFDNPRYTLQEEMCAEAVKMILNDVPDLELGDFIKKGYACCYSYFSDVLEQQQCMHWIIHDYLGLSGVPAFRVESGGATPIDAIINASLWIRAGFFPVVLVVGWEKMNELNISKVNEAIAIAGDTDWDFVSGFTYNAFYATLETRRMHIFGETEEDLAEVSVLEHNNSLDNPYAQWPARHGFSKITVEDVYESRLISWPYRLLECAVTSEGAAALLLANEKMTKELTDNPVWITGLGFGTDTMRPGDRPDNPAWKGLYPKDEKIWPKEISPPRSPYPELTNFGAFRVAAEMAYKDAGIRNPRKEISLAEIFAPYTGVLLAALEDLGFCKRGEGKKLLREGVIAPDGELPCQLSGALTAQGHAVGATSIAQVVDVYWQLSGQIGEKWGAPARQLSGLRGGLIHGHGGTGCQAGVVVLEV